MAKGYSLKFDPLNADSSQTFSNEMVETFTIAGLWKEKLTLAKNAKQRKEGDELGIGNVQMIPPAIRSNYDFLGISVAQNLSELGDLGESKTREAIIPRRAVTAFSSSINQEY